jgi:hypothetical protein
MATGKFAESAQTFKHISPKDTKVSEIISLELRALRVRRGEIILALILTWIKDIPQSVAEQIKTQDDQ